MNLAKELLRSLILEEMSKSSELNEANDEEIGYLDDLLEVPKDALPFHDIFGDRYRVLSSFKSDKPDSPFAKFENFLNRTGWTFSSDNMGQVEKSITTSYIASAEKGVEQRTKVEKTPLVKWIQGLLEYLDNISTTMNAWQKTMKDMQEYANNTFKKEKGKPIRGFKKEYLEDKNYINMFRKRLGLKKSIMKYLPPSSTMNVFSGIGRIDWEKDVEKQMDDYFSISNLKSSAQNFSEYIFGATDGDATVRVHEFFTGKKYDEYKASLGEAEYVVFSRHPIDVFRMSDHEGLQSCHTVPSSRKKLGATPSDEKWDQYNICALAEAHANGMIAYAFNPDDFKEAPTQELIDQYENGELFSDDERGVEGFTPIARLRIKNIAFLKDKGDYSEIVTRVAVPDTRTYGDTIPGFRTHVNKVIATAQKSKIEDILNNFSGEQIDLRRFLRVGGSYQDESINGVVTEFFATATGREDLEFEQTVQYSSDLEQSLKDEHIGDTKETAEAKLQDLVSEYNGSYVNFSNLSVEEDWNGTGFFMTGQVRMIYDYAEEIEYVAGKQDVRDLMYDAVEYASETYFYDDGWFEDNYVLFDTFWGGYKNVMIIGFDITHFNEEHNPDYNPFDPDTWMYALSEIKDKLSFVMDRHDDESLNNTVKDYISYNSVVSSGEEVVRTDVSEKYYLSKFKTLLDEDGNWDIDEEELDNDNPLGFDVLTSFTAEFSDSAALGSMFGFVNEDFDPENPEIVEMAKRMSGHITTIVSMLQSEGMNVLKAGLLNQAFLSNQSLYSSLSQATKLNELEMKVEASIGWDDEISPGRILQGIADDDDLSLIIKITCEDWDAITIETVGKMMLGKFNDNNGWHVDVDECLEALVRADIPTAPVASDIQETIRKEIINLLQA